MQSCKFKPGLDRVIRSGVASALLSLLYLIMCFDIMTLSPEINRNTVDHSPEVKHQCLTRPSKMSFSLKDATQARNFQFAFLDDELPADGERLTKLIFNARHQSELRKSKCLAKGNPGVSMNKSPIFIK